MARRARPMPAELKELRSRIERWRRTRDRRTAMPPELWAAAVALAGRHGVYPAARGAGVSFEGLRRRIAEAESRTTTVAPSSTFVEMTGAQWLGTPASPGTVVELWDPLGNRLAIRLAREAPLDVAGLVAAFRQRRA